MKDYYIILGLPKTATAAEIDAAFRRLARKYHPDVQPEEKDALALFKSAKEAHDVLSDAEKRREYDRKRSRGRRRSAMHPRDPLGRAGHDLEDLSRVWAETSRSMASAGQPRPRPAQDVEAELRLVPEEANRGGPLEVRISVRQACHACQGPGDAAEGPCAVCGGEGTVWESRLLQLRLPPGLRDGTVLCIAGQGGTAGPNAPRGDLYLVVRVRPCWASGWAGSA
jgi:DnaJ-class molecular chaperone